MKTYNVMNNQILLNLKQTNKLMETLTEQLSTSKKINAPKDDPSGWVNAKNHRAGFNMLNSINSSLNSVAMNIRVADQSMETIGQHIDQMKSTLQRIVDNYPIIPEGDEERTKLLQSYNTLRTMIDDLTMPSNDRGARKIMADPNRVSEAGDWEIMVNENGTTRVIHSRPVHTGPDGLNIAQLNVDATDEEIRAAIDSLTKAKETLNLRQAGLAFDAEIISNYQDHNEKFAEIYRQYADEIETTDTTEAAAELKSVELRQSLSVESIGSLTQAQSNLLSLWR
jgi:flagellin-like hook-associated protein FlgL